MVKVQWTPEDYKWHPKAAGAVVAEWLGWMLDSYDFALVTALTPFLATVLFPPSMSSSIISYFMTLLGYTFTIIGRPVGSAIFGNLADRIGRRDTLLFTLLGLGIMSAATAAIPTYAQVGWLTAFTIYAILRFVLGIFAGGEYAAGYPFVMEYVAPRWRGIIGGFTQSGYPFGVGLGGLVTSAFVAFFGVKAMYAYAWRYVFLTGLIPMVVGLAVRFLMPETPIFEEVKEKGQLEKIPFFSLFKPPTLWVFLQVFVLMTGLFFYYLPYVYFQVGVYEAGGLSVGLAEFFYGIGGWFGFIGQIIAGTISDFTGRRLGFIIEALVTAVGVIPAFYLSYYAALIKNTSLLWLSAFLTGFLTMWAWGIVPSYLPERFATQRRGSGVGFGYSSGIFISAWIPLYSIPLYAFFGHKLWLVAGFWSVLGAILIIIGAVLGPETIGTNLRAVAEKLR